MSLQWGIGIEHELLSYLQGETVTGATVIDQTSNEHQIRRCLLDELVEHS